jgi:hypothetical protein
MLGRGDGHLSSEVAAVPRSWGLRQPTRERESADPCFSARQRTVLLFESFEPLTPFGFREHLAQITATDDATHVPQHEFFAPLVAGDVERELIRYVVVHGQILSIAAIYGDPMLDAGNPPAIVLKREFIISCTLCCNAAGLATVLPDKSML